VNPQQCIRHPDAHRHDIKEFINRPVPRLLRYALLLEGILGETPPNHEDRRSIPQVLDVIKALGKETEPGVHSAEQKVELWRYNSNLVFKPGEYVVSICIMDKGMSTSRSYVSAAGHGSARRQPFTHTYWQIPSTT
jgi:hypothetical protein